MIGRALNSPFVIWMLTSIGVGLISFLYSQWTENQSVRLANERQATKVFFEAQFRISQMDEILEMTDSRLVGGQDPATDAMLLLFAGIKLGGITSFPLGNEARVWVNGTGIGNGRLPAGRGYQDQDFQGQSLFTLWYNYNLYVCEVHPVNKGVADLRVKFQELKKLIQKNIDKEQAKEIIKQAEDKWEYIKTYLTMFSHPAPHFDREKFC